MTDMSTERLIETLASDARPVKPLAPPLRRALAALAVAAVAGAILVILAGDMDGMLRRYSGREPMMVAEMAAMVATAVLAIVGAFILSIPGRSRAWLLAPLPSFLLWFGLSGAGCLFGAAAPDAEHSVNCLTFLLGASLVVGAPLLWLLSRARPIEPLPTALLGGLGAAALSALLLQFFHPFELTPIDLAVHFATVLLVLAIAAASRRRILAPA